MIKARASSKSNSAKAAAVSNVCCSGFTTCKMPLLLLYYSSTKINGMQHASKEALESSSKNKVNLTIRIKHVM